MPELAEVEFYRKRWDVGLGQQVNAVRVNTAAKGRFYKYVQPLEVQRALKGKSLLRSWAHGKQMLFEFSRGVWLGVHLGMSGTLDALPTPEIPRKHDHLVLVQKEYSLVFNDPRLFGFVKLHQGSEPPDWWQALPPSLVGDGFSYELFVNNLTKHSGVAIKTVLLKQDKFPGIGNWMADEILWRARIHPEVLAGALRPQRLKRLYAKVREVCEDALRVIGESGGGLRRDMLRRPPDTWLFNHRWRAGGTCPETGKPLGRMIVGGRTTCYSPSWQRR